MSQLGGIEEHEPPACSEKLVHLQDDNAPRNSDFAQLSQWGKIRVRNSGRPGTVPASPITEYVYYRWKQFDRAHPVHFLP
jgi:hypothetical protein